MYSDSKTLECKGDLACPMIRTLSTVKVLVHSGLVIRCCPMAESQLILEFLFLHERGDCYSITFLPDPRGACCFILSASLCVVHSTCRASHHKLHNFFVW